MQVTLLTYAKGDLRAAINSMKDVKNTYESVDMPKTSKYIASYHIQQAIEKAIKHEIYKKQPNINPKAMYTHDLLKLSMKASSLGIHIPTEIYNNALLYNSWEMEYRYNIPFYVSINSIKKAIHITSNWLDTLS